MKMFVLIAPLLLPFVLAAAPPGKLPFDGVKAQVKYDADMKAAAQAWQARVLVAEKAYQKDLAAAIKVAMADNDLDGANALKAERDASVARVATMQPATEAAATRPAMPLASHWVYRNGRTAVISPDGDLAMTDHRDSGTWALTGDRLEVRFCRQLHGGQ